MDHAGVWGVFHYDTTGSFFFHHLPFSFLYFYNYQPSFTTGRPAQRRTCVVFASIISPLSPLGGCTTLLCTWARASNIPPYTTDQLDHTRPTFDEVMRIYCGH